MEGIDLIGHVVKWQNSPTGLARVVAHNPCTAVKVRWKYILVECAEDGILKWQANRYDVEDDTVPQLTDPIWYI